MCKRFYNFLSTLFPFIPHKDNWREVFEEYDRKSDERLKDSRYWQKIHGDRESEYKRRFLNVYRSRQFVIQGSAELLSPTDVLQFVDDLAAAGFVVKRVIGWEKIMLPDGRYVYTDDLDCHFHVDVEYLYREHPVKDSVPIVKDYISRLPEHISHVYLEPFTPMLWEWELFPEKWQAREQKKNTK